MGYIRVQGIGKAYKRYPHKWGRAAEWLGLGQHHSLHWVLRGITLEVNSGEAVGIIGLNGAGKSTLLKIITGTTRATEGRVEVGGRVAALLELGIGFHPELTGRQNVWNSARLAGLPPEVISAVMPDIEAFADIGDYMDQPVRTYSSGMQVRVAFAVATAVRPDILVVDEALAVGDVFFQQKCFERIREFRAAGTTLLFVSHAMNTIYSLCQRAVLLDAGRLVCDDSPRVVIDLYNAHVANASGSGRLQVSMGTGGTGGTGGVGELGVGDLGAGSGSGAVGVGGGSGSGAAGVGGGSGGGSGAVGGVRDGGVGHGAGVRGGAGSYAQGDAVIEAVQVLHEGQSVHTLVCDSEMVVRVRVRFFRAIADPHVGMQVRDRRGEVLYRSHTHGMGVVIGAVGVGEAVEVDFAFRAVLIAGDYTVTVGVAEDGVPDGHLRQSLTRLQDAVAFTLSRNIRAAHWDGVVNLEPVCLARRVG